MNKPSIWETDRTLAAILDSLSAQVVTLDSSGCVEYASRAWLNFGRQGGADAAAISSGANYLEICRQAADQASPLAREAFEGINRVLQGRISGFSLEYPCHEPDGRARWFLMNVDPMPPGHGGVVISHVDITARKSAEEALGESEGRNRAILQALPDMIFIQTRDGVYLDYHAKDPHALFLPPESFLGKNMNEVLPVELARALEHCFRLAAESNEPILHEYSLPLKQGTRHYEARIVRHNGDKILTVVRDTTERKQAEQALQNSRALLTAVLDNCPAMIFLKDPEGRYRFANPEFEAITHRSAAEIVGKTDFEIFSQPQADAFRANDLKILESGVALAFEEVALHDDGPHTSVVCKFPVFDAEGKIHAIGGIVTDITERTRAEEELREALAEVRRLKDRLEAENVYLRSEVSRAHRFGDLIGHSAGIEKVFEQVEQVAETDMTVLVIGETGTGKELVARAVHEHSGRKERPLVKVNCSALPGELIESELFGHEKGAFTGASSRQVGRFELADGGTIFLDEVAELSLGLQAKLLRVLQDGEFERLGSGRTIKVDVRVIAATNRNLNEAMQEGRFRSDLYYRLNVYPIRLPPLRERREDLGLLAQAFLTETGRRLGRGFAGIPPGVLEALQRYDWPGNVRELQNVIERATVTSTGPLFQLPEDWGTPSGPEQSRAGKVVAPEAKVHAARESKQGLTLEEVRRGRIVEVLQQTGWRIEGPNGAAIVLGLNPSTLRSLMSKLGVSRPGKGNARVPKVTANHISLKQ
jgi:PAS domain S-box-containing protein